MDQQLDEHQRTLVLKAVAEVAPLEVEVLGPAVVEDILAGAHFESVVGGSHLSIVDGANLISAFFSIASFLYSVVRDASADRSRLPPPRRFDAAPDEVKQAVRTLDAHRTGLSSEFAEVLDAMRWPESAT